MNTTAKNASPYSAVIRAALLGLVVNFILGVAKLIGGILGSSFALISDAVNSLGDVFMSLVVLFALHVAQRPPDEEHPYGHTRAEAIAGSNISLLLIVSALLVGWEAIQRIDTIHPLPPTWTLWIAAINVVIKETLYQYYSRIGRLSQSSVIAAGAWDHRADALCSLAVLFGLATVRWGGTAWIAADEVASLFIVVTIIWSGAHLFRSSASELMDVQADDAFVSDIKMTAESVCDVRAVETLWVRKSGLEYFVDIHIEVDQDLSVAEGHTIGHEVKDVLLAEYPQVRNVMVHLEPFPHEHTQVSEASE